MSAPGLVLLCTCNKCENEWSQLGCYPGPDCCCGAAAGKNEVLVRPDLRTQERSEDSNESGTTTR